MTAELLCLALAVYYEARSEPLLGQAAVAEVVLNRVESPKYPSTICDVVTQGGTQRYACQFSYWCDGKAENPRHRLAWRRAKVVAQLTQAGVIRTRADRATHYHATYVEPYWRQHLEPVTVIGLHHFYVDARAMRPTTLAANVAAALASLQ
jgi:spore germination cell wall hydrolase CwlJ-like protein